MQSVAWDQPPPAREVVEAWLDRLRPALVADGGNVELLSVEADGTVRIALQGACSTCPARLATLRIGLEEPLKQQLAGVQAVVAVESA
ncbi:MAG: NifU family protein [Spirochaetaceae bacterium]|nr:NifU family protein [Myxococcales bacterium]MCB9724455.1 NifU family protein [Spirochaetaceae bacterium]HPG25894.1 NifU family protein [Myxococcota bacterium]